MTTKKAAQKANEKEKEIAQKINQPEGLTEQNQSEKNNAPESEEDPLEESRNRENQLLTLGLIYNEPSDKYFLPNQASEIPFIEIDGSFIDTATPEEWEEKIASINADLISLENQSGKKAEENEKKPEGSDETNIQGSRSGEEQRGQGEESLIQKEKESVLESRKQELINRGFLFEEDLQVLINRSWSKPEETSIPLDQIQNMPNEEFEQVLSKIDKYIADIEFASTGLPTLRELNRGYKVFPKDEPINAKETHEARVKKYGEGYVVATKQNLQAVFTKTAWEARRGVSAWAEALEMPEEVLSNYWDKQEDK